MKVLIVEDEPKLAGFVKKGLEEQAWEVDVAYDGQIGVSLALSTLYDVIVLDVNLPKMNGFELAALLRREDVRTPILMLTALGTLNDKLAWDLMQVRMIIWLNLSSFRS
jgi:two-component system copper resistance phosphate regulon response regulator CusR